MSSMSYLVETKEAKVLDDADGTDPRLANNLTRHLQADLHDLQRVGEHHLRRSSLRQFMLL